MSEIIKSEKREYTINQQEAVDELMQMFCSVYKPLTWSLKWWIRDSEDSSGYKYFSKRLIWNMLTIIDSIIEDKERRDATKSIVRQMIAKEIDDFIDDVYYQFKMN